MLEWLITIGAAELGKAVFEQVLKLGQSAAEDYVKDFFKGCLKGSIAGAKPEVTRKAVAAALKEFLVLMTDELEDQGLSKAEIRDRYDQPLIQFVKEQSVKPILGLAFEKDCTTIDTVMLAATWQQSHFKGKPFPLLPAQFNWQRIGSEYIKKVRRIVREMPELRSLLETELLEDIARNTTQLSPGFDVAKYRDSLQCSYGHLKLYAIDSTDRVDAIKLWNMFIEQTVREALPPMRYELPLDLKRHLQATGQLETNLSAAALDHYRTEYFQQPSRKILKTVAEAKLAVILGDPGAGKSTLLQYLALEWVEGKREELPLLIELREYAVAQVHGFLEFLHRGRGADWQFDQQQLHQHLQAQPTRVMFDGLDEVFDRPTQSAIIDDIIRFAQHYPKAQVLITSRIIGYNPDRFQHAGFRQFTIQPLDTDEIHEFIDCWYTLALGNDPDKSQLVTRLKDAIANSKAIQNLADNPLLLTMMAILNRRQELPRDRADLYKKASELLLHKWDAEAKSDLKDPRWGKYPIEISHQDKQVMLQQVAYFIQASGEGLKGNYILREDLENCLKSYLKTVKEAQSAPSIALLLIDQLRNRDSILCHYGADTYGFVHRTFLEYFCAMEIVQRFEKQRTLTFEQLRDEVFGQHWQDEAWHEVLRLICGAIAPKFAGDLIEFLIGLEILREPFIERKEISVLINNSHAHSIESVLLTPKGVGNLLLAADCLIEIHDFSAIFHIRKSLLNRLQHEVEEPEVSLSWATSLLLMKQIAKSFRGEPTVLLWLQNCVEKAEDDFVKRHAVRNIAEFFRDQLGISSWLKAFAGQANTSHWSVHETALKAVINWFGADFDVLNVLQVAAKQSDDWDIRRAATNALGKHWCKHPGILKLLLDIASTDPFVRQQALQANPRQVALEALLAHYPTHPELIALLHNRAAADPDEQLRQWAQGQL